MLFGIPCCGRRSPAGQDLCRQGDEGDRVWLLASGRLVALRHTEPPQQVSAPALVGESILLAQDLPQTKWVGLSGGSDTSST